MQAIVFNLNLDYLCAVLKNLHPMASFIYCIRTTQKDASADVMIRIRFSEYVDGKKVAAYVQSGVKVPKKAWDEKKSAIKTSYTSTSNSDNGSGDSNNSDW